MSERVRCRYSYDVTFIEHDLEINCKCESTDEKKLSAVILNCILNALYRIVERKSELEINVSQIVEKLNEVYKTCREDVECTIREAKKVLDEVFGKRGYRAKLNVKYRKMPWYAKMRCLVCKHFWLR